jgi:uncharacterized protein (DUF58 family)
MGRVLRWVYYAVILAVLGVGCYFFHSYVLLMLLGGAVLLPIGSVVLFYTAVGRVSGSLNTDSLRVNIGESAVINLELANRSLYPFSRAEADIRVQNLFFGSEVLSVKAPLSAIIGARVRTELLCTECGMLRAELDSIRVWDMLGLVSVSIEADSVMSIAVMPLKHSIDVPERVASNTEIAADGGSVQSLDGDISGAREYVYGDRLNSISWKLTARMNKLMVKEFEQNVSNEYVLLTDTCRRSIGSAMDNLYSLGNELLVSGKCFYVMWQGAGCEQPDIVYVTTLKELDLMMEDIYMSQPQSLERVALYTYRRLNAESEVIYIGERVERL